MFGLWYVAIIGKFITMAYQLDLLNSKVKINKFQALWTKDIDEMVTLESLNGLELLIVAGFIQWHYLFSVIYGALAHCAERTIASLLIDNYETNSQLYIPIVLTFTTQSLAISTSYAVLFDKVDIIILNILWMSTCVISLGEWIPQFLCHFVENGVLLNPLWICPVFMYSLPAWKEQFNKAFPGFWCIRGKRKLGVVNVEQVEDVKKRISMETNTSQAMIIRMKSTNQTFWLPIYIMNDSSFQSGPYLVLLIFECILYIITGAIICSTVKIFLKIRLFHRNMNIMKTLFLCQWFEAIVAKMVIIPYQIGLLTLTDSPQPYVSWWSDADSEEIIHVEQASPTVYAILIASFLVWHYAYSMIFGILNLGVERIFASVLLKDYEKKPRVYIPVILILSTHIVTFGFSYLVLTNRTGFYIGTAPCFVNSGLTFLMYIIVLKVNKSRRQKLELPGCDYSLAQQFQVKENYRALKLAKNLLIAVLCAMSVPCALLILIVMGFVPTLKIVVIHVMENSIYLNPIIVCSVLMFSSTVWRDEYLNLIPGWNRFRIVRVFMVRPKPRVTHRASGTPTEGHDEGLVYFEQLKKSWM